MRRDRSVRSRRDRALAWLMPAVLILVACTQVFLAHTRDLTPWRGGGFGMFASVDVPTWRAMHGTFFTEEGEIPFDVHALGDAGREGHEAFTNARAWLGERHGARLAELIKTSEWVVEGRVARFHDRLEPGTPGPVLRSGPHDDDPVIEVLGGRIEVWRPTYERRSHEVVPEPAGSYEFVIEEPP